MTNFSVKWFFSPKIYYLLIFKFLVMKQVFTLLSFFAVLMLSITLYAQVDGDYRSAGDGLWMDKNTWEVYKSSNDTWVAANKYPGEVAGDYSITIMRDPITDEPHNVIFDLNNTFSSFDNCQPMGELIIYGNLILNGTPSTTLEVYLNVTYIYVVYEQGIIFLNSKVHLLVPDNSFVEVYMNEDIYPEYYGLDIEQSDCSNVQSIYIGDINISDCVGLSNSSLDFWELMSIGGTLNTNILYDELDCSSFEVTLNASYSGLNNFEDVLPSNFVASVSSPTWTIETPNETITSNATTVVLNLDEDGVYTVTLSYTFTFGKREEVITNYETLEIPSIVSVWNGSNWSPGVPDISTRVYLNGDYNTSVSGSFSCCSMQLESNKTLNIKSNDYVEVETNIINNGHIDIDHGGSIVQNTNDSFVDGTGAYSIEKTTTSYHNNDYINWSTPLDNQIFSDVFTEPAQRYLSTFVTSNFLDEFQGRGRPQTIPGGDGFDDNGDDWVWLSASSKMDPGVGYSVLGPTPTPFKPINLDNIYPEQTVYFTGGKINNGTISVPVTLDKYNILNGSPDQTHANCNFIGNPYPSAIDLKKLLENNPILTGTFYIWTHYRGMTSDIGPDTHNFFVDDYAVLTIDEQGIISYTTNGSGYVPSNFIPSGQAFFADVNQPGTVDFDNSIRVLQNNTPVIRSVENKELDRFKLVLSHSDNPYNEILIGFNDYYSDNYVPGEDAQRKSISYGLGFYSQIPDQAYQLAIQNLSSFNNDRIISLGINAIKDDIYTISLKSIEGIFNGSQDIYLFDKVENKVHLLNKSDYSFNLTEGIHKDRFAVIFKDRIDNSDDLISIYPNPSKGNFNISNLNSSQLKISVFNTNGQLIKSYSNQSSIDLSGLPRGIYIAKIQSDKNSFIKKLILD